MANTTLTQTGAQVQSILDKADKLPATVGTSGQVLTSDGTNLSWTTPQGGGGGGTQWYKHTLTGESLGERVYVAFFSKTSTSYTYKTIVNDREYIIINGYGYYDGNYYKLVNFDEYDSSDKINPEAYGISCEDNTETVIVHIFGIHKNFTDTVTPL